VETSNLGHRGDLGLPPSISKGEIGGGAGRLDELAEESPAGAIVEAYSRLERVLRTLLTEHDEDIDEGWDIQTLAGGASQKGLITSQTSKSHRRSRHLAEPCGSRPNGGSLPAARPRVRCPVAGCLVLDHQPCLGLDRRHFVPWLHVPVGRDLDHGERDARVGPPPSEQRVAPSPATRKAQRTNPRGPVSQERHQRRSRAKAQVT
jgi:hypothetical protein